MKDLKEYYSRIILTADKGVAFMQLDYSKKAEDLLGEHSTYNMIEIVPSTTN